MNYALGGPFFVGAEGYTAQAADFDRDGKADPGIYQRERGDWKVLLSSAGYYPVELLGFLGETGYRAVAADYDGDYKTDPAVFLSATGNWIILLSSAGYARVELPGFLM